MSSRKRQGADLLVRLRYQNPLPLPPFGPKALNCDTDLGRFGRDVQALRALEGDRQVAFVADGELGMPLDLGNANDRMSYLSGHRDTVTFDTSKPAQLDPEDEELCAPFGADSSSSAVGGPSASTSANAAAKKISIGGPNAAGGRFQSKPSTSNVAWLRRPEMDAAPGRVPDRSRSGTPRRKPVRELSSEEKRQLVTSGFDVANAPLEGLQHPHPSKRHLKAVSSVPILPDEQIWGNNYHLYRFPDPPSEEPNRSEHALLRTVNMPDGEVRIGYYLTPDQEAAARLEASQRSKAPADYGDPGLDHVLDESEHAHHFQLVREYEPANHRSLNSEFLFSMEPQADALPEGAEPSRPTAAYYTSLNSLQVLKRRRPRKGEDPHEYGPVAFDMGIQKWHVIKGRLGLAPNVMGEYEQRRRDLASFQPPQSTDMQTS